MTPFSVKVAEVAFYLTRASTLVIDLLTSQLVGRPIYTLACSVKVGKLSRSLSAPERVSLGFFFGTGRGLVLCLAFFFHLDRLLLPLSPLAAGCPWSRGLGSLGMPFFFDPGLRSPESLGTSSRETTYRAGTFDIAGQALFARPTVTHFLCLALAGHLHHDFALRQNPPFVETHLRAFNDVFSNFRTQTFCTRPPFFVPHPPCVLISTCSFSGRV